ncbi:hypothetical protein [Desulfobotulus mexicanus]|uniref:Uncharacterized protein n=1 Tax=Desulfobotulus mexicanus TaxID=2586642 RepID=A0A5Q4VCN3_9BACT|nr:hypothetical protein [Desulfobotulus mexicanus]TYT74686.1 hypothetical protein FIM25_08845 [Desulfobotulus mexicanus]
MKKQKLCIIAITCFLFSTPAFSSDWSGMIKGRLITCKVTNIQESILGVWESFDVHFETGTEKALFSCSGNPLLHNRKCQQSRIEGKLQSEKSSVNINLRPGTTDARHKICAETYGQAGFSLEESGPIQPY